MTAPTKSPDAAPTGAEGVRLALQFAETWSKPPHASVPFRYLGTLAAEVRRLRAAHQAPQDGPWDCSTHCPDRRYCDESKCCVYRPVATPQPAEQPVAWLMRDHRNKTESVHLRGGNNPLNPEHEDWIPLYTHPAEAAQPEADRRDALLRECRDALMAGEVATAGMEQCYPEIKATRLKVDAALAGEKP